MFDKKIHVLGTLRNAQTPDSSLGFILGCNVRKSPPEEATQTLPISQILFQSIYTMFSNVRPAMTAEDDG